MRTLYRTIITTTFVLALGVLPRIATAGEVNTPMLRINHDSTVLWRCWATNIGKREIEAQIQLFTADGSLAAQLFSKIPPGKTENISASGLDFDALRCRVNRPYIRDVDEFLVVGHTIEDSTTGETLVAVPGQ